MDLLAELENMVINVGDESDAEQEQELSDDVITRWQQLFCYTHTEAIDRINQYRSNFSRKECLTSTGKWYAVASKLKAGGIRAGVSVGQASSESTYIIKLEGPLDTAAKIQEAAGLETVPAIITGTGDLGEASSVTIDSTAKDAIIAWLSEQRISFAPIFIRVSKSGKELSDYSIHPTLGVDSTLPQYRADSVDAKVFPTQNQYPVWYFFYGNLAVPEILTRRLALSEPPIFTPATVSGGVIKRWKGTYNALLDGPDTVSVDGWAYLVATEEHEDALRFYETENYEIIRCSIAMK